jgi:phytoene dehydrogenase-like protein
MEKKHVVIVGGGLAGLSAGCYALANGFRATIVEHNLELGGVCTAWARGPYTVDGCIHWLTGGPFDRIYRELGIFPKVSVQVMRSFATYRDAKSGASVEVTGDLEAFARALIQLAPEDEAEIRHVVDGARTIASMEPPMDHPPELTTFRESLGALWEMRGGLGTLVHFRMPLGTWIEKRLSNAQVRRIFARLMPPETPMFFLVMVLGYLARGYLSRPYGGTQPFRDALIENFRAMGGEARLNETVDEIRVEGDRAVGVRLSDGTDIAGDYVISTSSAPETVFRLLGGRYGASELRTRLEAWKLFDPIVLASYGVAAPLSDVPPTLLIDRIQKLDVGGRENEHLYLRIYNDDPAMAPEGHTVVQAMLSTDYAYWARLGANYTAEKDVVAERVLRRIEEYIPAVKGAVRMVDVATPITYFRMARSYHGAFEGWLPSPDAFFHHVKKTLPGLSHFYMAGQWVEPGGGVPTALMSGRQVIQLLCAEDGQSFGAASTRLSGPVSTNEALPGLRGAL